MQKAVVLVLREPGQFSAKLAESGCEVIDLEMIRIERDADAGHLDIAELKDLDGLFFTSPHAARVFLESAERSSEKFGGDIYVLGQRTRDLFAQAGIDVRYHEDANTAAEMIALFGESEFAGKRLLYLRGNRSLRQIPQLLEGIADIQELVVYKTVDATPDTAQIKQITERLRNREIDWMCFFSPSGVENLIKMIDPADLKRAKAAAIGETTANALRTAGLDVALVSRRARAEDLAAQLVEYINNLE